MKAGCYIYQISHIGMITCHVLNLLTTIIKFGNLFYLPVVNGT